LFISAYPVALEIHLEVCTEVEVRLQKSIQRLAREGRSAKLP